MVVSNLFVFETEEFFISGGVRIFPLSCVSIPVVIRRPRGSCWLTCLADSWVKSRHVGVCLGESEPAESLRTVEEDRLHAGVRVIDTFPLSAFLLSVFLLTALLPVCVQAMLSKNLNVCLSSSGRPSALNPFYGRSKDRSLLVSRYNSSCRQSTHFFFPFQMSLAVIAPSYASPPI